MARPAGANAARGLTVLIYHRVGGGSSDELDLEPEMFAAQLDVLSDHDVVSLDTALDRLDAGDSRPSVALTFDDGYVDVHTHAWPLLRERRLPFTVYLASSFVGEALLWEGSTRGSPGTALSWSQLEEFVSSGLATVGNHTHTHPRPERLSAADIDACTRTVVTHLGVDPPRHFAFPWGIEVPELRADLAKRFRSAVTGSVGRNQAGADRLALRRVPVRRSDPLEFFAAKLTGRLLPERGYDLAVRLAKRMGARA